MGERNNLERRHLPVNDQNREQVRNELIRVLELSKNASFSALWDFLERYEIPDDFITDPEVQRLAREVESARMGGGFDDLRIFFKLNREDSIESKEGHPVYTAEKVQEMIDQGGIMKIHQKDGSVDSVPIHLYTLEIKDGVLRGFLTKQLQGDFEIPLENIILIEKE